MTSRPLLCSAAVLLCSLTACASRSQLNHSVVGTSPAAAAILRASQQAHGAAALAKHQSIRVQYDGKWAWLGPKFQPVLVDQQYRGGSVETLTLRPRQMAQTHRGPSGQKQVERTPTTVAVRYNGVPATDPEQLQTAALVADAYQLFLLGPNYFTQPNLRIMQRGTSLVDGFPCDDLLVLLQPGFGMAEEDRVQLSVDRQNHYLRRVRLTLNGLASTVGAEVEVTFREFLQKEGVLWPTDFDERIRVPFDLPAHHWKLLEVNLR